MNVLEKILEEMLNYERVVKTDEDLEWNRAMYRCSEIIRSHMVEKEKVSSAEIISRNIDGKPYYEIKYKKVGEDYYTVGYSSYTLDYVVNWLNECFEFCGEAKVSIGYGKDTNVPSNEGWISVEERLPNREECQKNNREFFVLDENGNRFCCEYDSESNGYDNPKWCCNTMIVAWQNFPQPYKPEEN